MPTPSRPAALVADVLSKLFFLAAGFLFFLGGRALHDFLKMDRFSAEVLCDMSALVFAALGAAAHVRKNRINQSTTDVNSS